MLHAIDAFTFFILEVLRIILGKDNPIFPFADYQNSRKNTGMVI